MHEIALDGNVRKTLEFPDARTVNLNHASDVYVMTSLIEGMPLVLMESMAAGLPIVASDVPGCRDLIERTKAGLLADVANPADVAAKIGEILSDAYAPRRADHPRHGGAGEPPPAARGGVYGGARFFVLDLRRLG
jgi:glycosyltransferase involved in cell wall biosynthesis